jgi:predicted RNA binding protein YcfA (HicA-like mRNA interferase family)
MPIEYHKVRNITARKFISALIKDGFYLRSQKGSHQRYYHIDGRMVTVAFHKSSDTFPLTTLRKMVEDQARWTEEDLTRIGILK